MEPGASEHRETGVPVSASVDVPLSPEQPPIQSAVAQAAKQTPSTGISDNLLNCCSIG
jgi:hypothetical protein